MENTNRYRLTWQSPYFSSWVRVLTLRAKNKAEAAALHGRLFPSKNLIVKRLYKEKVA
jgi:hypothetical protein